MIEIAAALGYVFIAYYTFLMVSKGRDMLVDMKEMDENALTDNTLKFYSAIWPIYYVLIIIAMAVTIITRN
jgi:hypothetical protein